MKIKPLIWTQPEWAQNSYEKYHIARTVTDISVGSVYLKGCVIRAVMKFSKHHMRSFKTLVAAKAWIRREWRKELEALTE